jgi:hypothetical protein
MPDPGSLYIRWRADGSDDNRTDPNGANFVHTPSLAVIDDNVPNPPDDGVATTGVDQQIRVRVDTTLSTPNVVVQAWACAWGTAGMPFLASAGGEDGLERELDDQLDPFVADPAPPANQLEVLLDWRPELSDLIDIGAPTNADLKVCLLANVYSTAGIGDGAKLVPPILPSHDPTTNRHHAQRNIAVHPVMNFAGKFKFNLFAGSTLLDGEEQYTIDVTQPRKPTFPRETLTRLQKGRWLVEGGQLAGKGGKLRLADAPLREVGLSVGGERASVKAFELPLAAGKPQLLEVEAVLPEADPGTLHVVDIVQRRGKRFVGGARALVLAVDEERFSHFKRDRASAV